MSTLLRYAVTTDPFPLQASAESGPLTRATLTLVATNATSGAVTLQGLIVQLPVGDGATALTDTPPSAADLVPPTNWTLHDTQHPTGFVEYIFQPEEGHGGIGQGQELTFVFNNIAVNRTPGTFQGTIEEGSNDCQPPDCPTASFDVTKFPHGWGTVSFWVDPPEIGYGDSTTLHWDGPVGATYTIEYYTPQTGIVTIPQAGQPPLAASGQYPATGAPPLTLDQTTTFTLNISEQIDHQTYHAQDQKTVTVSVPPPKITAFTGTIALQGMKTTVILNWETEHATYCTITGDPNQLQPSSTNDSFKIFPTAQQPLLAGYTLTAHNAVGTATAALLIVWQAASEQITAGKGMYDVAISPNGQRAYTSAIADGTIWVFDLTKDPIEPVGQPVKVTKDPLGVAISPDGSRLFVVSRGGGAPLTITVFDVTKDPIQPIGKPFQSFNLKQFLPWGIAVSPDGQHAYVTSGGGSLSLFDVSTDPIKPVGEPATEGGGLHGVAVSPDGKRLFAAVSTSRALAEFDPTTLKPVGKPTLVGSLPAGVAVSPDGARAFVTLQNYPNDPNLLVVVDIMSAPFKPVGLPVKVGPFPSGVATTSDGTRVFVTDPGPDGSGTAISILIPTISGGTGA